MTPALNLSEPTADIAAHQTALHETEILSAWMDGVSASQTPGDTDPEAATVDRATWDTYHLIGDVMRTSDLAIMPTPAFSARLATALAAEPAHRRTPTRCGAQRVRSGFVLPRFARLKFTRLSFAPRRFALPSLALIAVLAWLLWTAQPFLDDSLTDHAVLAEAQRTSERRNVAVAGLHEYLDAHRQMVGPSVVRQVSVGGASFREVGLRHATLRNVNGRDGVAP